MTAVTGRATTAGGYVHPTPSTELVARGLTGRAVGGRAFSGRAPGGRALAGGTAADAAGTCWPVDGPVDLATSYELCRRLHAAHGRTYYLATRFLPRELRHHVHALYGFARYADDLVDHMDLAWSPARRRAELETWSDGFLASLASQTTSEPILVAVLTTVGELGIAEDDLHAFLRSMAMDLTVDRYTTYDDLAVYVHGSAAVIGSMMLPVLRPTAVEARPHALALGVAFQLTNFIRDVAEDAARGRIYLPLEDLERFGVAESDLFQGRATAGVRRLLAYEIARTRALYRVAEPGIRMLAPSSQACVRIAFRLYGGILDAVEDAGYDVFSVRATASRTKRVRVAAGEVMGARVAAGEVLRRRRRR